MEYIAIERWVMEYISIERWAMEYIYQYMYREAGYGMHIVLFRQRLSIHSGALLC